MEAKKRNLDELIKKEQDRERLEMFLEIVSNIDLKVLRKMIAENQK